MPYVFRPRKDIIELRPIPISGPKNYSYRWKMMALLEENHDGQYILPFSRRIVDIPLLLWPRSHRQPPPLGFELCGCTGCEKKKWQDHILYDDDDDAMSPYGNLHLDCQERDMDDGNNNDDKEQQKENSSPTDDEMDICPSSSSTTSEDWNMYDGDDDDDNNNLNNAMDSMSRSCYSSPFLYDPYESYDWEC